MKAQGGTQVREAPLFPFRSSDHQDHHTRPVTADGRAAIVGQLTPGMLAVPWGQGDEGIQQGEGEDL